jgi:S-adenosylmethionine hydrolase
LSSPKILTLTTDFGLRDSYVGQMKGAVLAVDHEIRVVDLCHEVPPQRILSGAYLLETGYAAFPAGSVHVAVVDPGVGTRRRPLAVRAGSHLFVAPDNGLLSRVLDREPLREAHVIEEERYLRSPRSATFEGRDLFAPAAAWLARGVEPGELGRAAGKIVRLPASGHALRPGVPAEIDVLHVDRFGNVALDLRADILGWPRPAGR